MTDRSEQIRRQSMEQYGFGPDAMKKVKVCTVCGQPSPNDRRFCTDCGTRLPNKTLYDRYKARHQSCPNCDTVVAGGSEFCPQCGRKIGRNINNDEPEEEVK